MGVGAGAVDAAHNTATPSAEAGPRRAHHLPGRAVQVVARLLDTSVSTSLAYPLLALVWVAATFFALVAHSVLPPNFFYDGAFIESIAHGKPFVEPDRVFATTGWLYRSLGLTLDPVLPTLFGMLIAAALVGSAILSRRRSTIPLSGLVLAAVALLFFSIYLGWYTKETFAAIAVTGAVLVLRTSAHPVWAVVPLGFYGATLRSYWLLVVGIYVALLVVERFRPLRWWRLGLWISGALVAASVGFLVMFGNPLQSIRALTNTQRDITDVGSLITAPLASSGIVADAVNGVAVLVLLVLPLTLFVTGQINHAIYGIAIAVLWTLPASSASRLRAPLPIDATHTERLDRRRAHASVYLLASFLTVFSIFEPDFGSYLRHLSALIPVMIVLAVAVHRPRTTDA